MSIALPPPAIPQLGTVEQLQPQASGGVVVAYQNYQVHVAANGLVDEATLNKVIAAADNISNAIRAIGGAAYAAGYPAAKVMYVASGNDVYVTVQPGEISSVKADDALKPYFEGVEAAKPLTASALEPRRMLASMLADRAGYEITPSLEPDGNGGTVLDLEKNVRKQDPTTINVDFGNPGSRYSSRWFLDLGLKAATNYGDEFRLSWREGVPNVETEPGGDYHEQNLGWTRVTPMGVMGFSGRLVNYDARTNGVDTNGRIWSVEGLYLYPILADFNTRWTAQGKVDYIDNQRDLDSTTTTPTVTFKREKYPSIEVSTSYTRNLGFLDHLWGLEGGVTLRKGFGDGENTTTLPLNGDEQYLLLRGVATAKVYTQPDLWFWKPSLTSGITLSGQYSGDTLPEQQQWVIGGLGNISSALPGIGVGDNGYLVRLFTETAAWNHPQVAGLSFTPRLFLESGAASYAGTNPIGTQSITDVGFDLAMRYKQWFESSFTYGLPIADDVPANQNNKANLYFRMGVKY